MKKLAIIKGIGFGVRDTNTPMMWFSVNTGEVASLICLSSKRAIDLIEKHQVSDIKFLEGKPCWINEEDSVITFIDLANI